jgi:phosphoglycolate phosphatase
VTDPVTDASRLASVLAATKYVLLDFDGPVCDVFAGRPARGIAGELRDYIAESVTTSVPASFAETWDPLDIVRQVADFAPQLALDIETNLRAAEREAVASAAPTPGTAEFLAACEAAGWPVAIVSNNSAPAIAAYLQQHHLDGYVQHIAGRDPSDPHRMKPDTFLLDQAVTALAADPATTVLIGDSITDIEAAHAYGVRVIAYVNKPEKHQTLSHADAGTTDMAALIPR